MWLYHYVFPICFYEYEVIVYGTICFLFDFDGAKVEVNARNGNTQYWVFCSILASVH